MCDWDVLQCVDFKIHNLVSIFFSFLFCLEKVCKRDSPNPGRKHILFINAETVHVCFASSWCQILEIYFKKKKKILKIPSWPSYSHKLYIWSRLAIKSRKTTTKCVLRVWLNKKFLFTSKRGCTHIQCDLYFSFYWKRWIFVFLFWKLLFSRWKKKRHFFQCLAAAAVFLFFAQKWD